MAGLQRAVGMRWRGGARGATTVLGALLASVMLVSPAWAPPGSSFDIPVVVDSMLRAGDRNTNEGANPVVSISGDGSTRIVLDFGPRFVATSASSVLLRLTVKENLGNWGSGKFISVYPLVAPGSFPEGTGKSFGLPPSDVVRGTGSGVTWNCLDDFVIANSAANCLGEPWSGGEIDAVIPNSSELITNETQRGAAGQPPGPPRQEG